MVLEAPGLLSRKTLQLNSDGTVMGNISVKKALSLLFRGVVYQIEIYKEKIRDSVGRLYDAPKTIVLKKYSKLINTDANFTKRNLILRDKSTCQYCKRKLKYFEATVDHVIPKSKGGKTNWTNTVLCCKKCNSKKGNKSLRECGFKLDYNPYTPKKKDLFFNE